MIIDSINSPDDLKRINRHDLPVLANEMRELLIKRASEYGGHFGSNLGAIELTIALHYVFDSPKDKIIFDVSHQSYPHKMLTGRKDAYIYPDKYDTVTGFTNPNESEHDYFNIGHTSTSISLALGLAKSRDLQGNNENIIAVIGDSSLDGGEAFEAINIAGELGTGLIIIVNDNDMSIPENHGALCKQLNALRDSNGVVENNYFKSLGLDYYFVRDGHSIDDLIDAFNIVKGVKAPVVIHCCTVKGKGYLYAEQNQEKWHHAHPFDIATGEFKKSHSVPKENYGSIVGQYLMDKMKSDRKVVAMTASVPTCFGFNKQRREEAGEQFIDVGIAEQNLVTMASAMAKGGCKPVIITESSFYQRAYDQIEQEMCRNKCPVTMLIAFSGIYAHNDDTHIGFFDISMMTNIPSLVYLAPTNAEEYLAMLEWSIEQQEWPVAIRIPWGGVSHTDVDALCDYSEVKYQISKHGNTVAILAVGDFYPIGKEVAEILIQKSNVDATLINPMFLTGYDIDTLENLKESHKLIVTIENGILSGGFGEHIASYYGMSDMKVLNCGFSNDIPTKFIKEDMLYKNGLNPNQIVDKIIRGLNIE